MDHVTLERLLQQTPPEVMVCVADAEPRMVRERYTPEKRVFGLPRPERLSFYCSTCEKDTLHDDVERRDGSLEVDSSDDETWECVLRVRCRNCQQRLRSFALIFEPKEELLLAVKLGQYPSFGERLPKELMKLTGDQSDLFLKGWKAEKAGLGIGAFSYYRRVVEAQRDALFDAVKKAAVAIGADGALVNEIEEAAKSWSFERSIDEIKLAIPDRLLVLGHNPFKLLHKAASKGLHDRTDEECLEDAQTIRMVLADLGAKLAMIRLEENDLRASVKRLLDRGN